MSRSRKPSVRTLLGIVGVVCLGACGEFLNAYDGLPPRVMIPPPPRIEPMRIRWYRMDDGIAGRASTIANSMARMAGKANPDCALLVVPWDNRNELVPPMRLGLPDHTRVDVIFDHDRDAILRRARSIRANVVLEARPRADFPSGLARFPARDFSGDPDDMQHRFRPWAPPLPPTVPPRAFRPIEIPAFEPPAFTPIEVPRIDTPAFTPIKVPRIDTPAFTPIEVPRIDTPVFTPIEVPRIDTPVFTPIEVPRIDTPVFTPIEMPTFETPRFDVPYSAFP